jgi:hypothetical protein
MHPLFTPTYFIITLSTPKYMHLQPLINLPCPTLYVRLLQFTFARYTVECTRMCESYGERIFTRNINGIAAYRIIWTVLPTRWNDSTVDLCGKLTWVCRTTHCCYLAWGLKNSKYFWSDSLRCPLSRCHVCHLLEIRMVCYNSNCQCYTA